MWEPKTSVNWVTLSPNYGSINTITTETDTVRVTVNTANMTVGDQLRPDLHLGYGSWDIAPDPVPIIVSVTQARFPLHRLRLL